MGAISASSAAIPALNGNVAVNGNLASSGSITAPSATVPALNGNVSINGNLSASGPVAAPSATTINAPSAAIPTLSGNVNVNGEMTAKVVTVTGGSDVAEPYHVASAADVKPVAGMVVAINPEEIGQMRIASRAYDKTVAGILSGANGIAPGITLRQAGTISPAKFYRLVSR